MKPPPWKTAALDAGSLPRAKPKGAEVLGNIRQALSKAEGALL